jgi:uncharacterized protein
MMWLVVGGPAVVVVAALMTVWIAVRSADVVLPREQVQAKNATELPAVQGRNHVAAPDKALH